MNKNEPNSCCMQEIDVVREEREFPIGHHFTAESDDESLAPESMKIGSDSSEPGHETCIKSGV